MKLIMHRFTTALILCAATFAAHAQTSNTTAKDDLFAGVEKFAKGASDVEEITMNPDTLARVGGHDGVQARGTVLNVVRTYSYPKPGMYNIADVEEFRNKINTGDWHCSVHISHPLKGESTDVCERHRTDELHESAIITVEPKELTFIHKITRNRTGTQSWNSYSSFGDGYSSAEMQAELAVQMAEMHAGMAGMNYGQWGGGYSMPLEIHKLEGLDSEQVRKLAKELKDVPAAGTQTAPSQKQTTPNTK